MSQRAKVLSIYKALQRTRQDVFAGDESALSYIRLKIKEEFGRFKSVEDPAEINNLLKVATDSEEILRTKVIQAQQVRPNVFQLRSDHVRAKCTDVRETCANCTCQEGEGRRAGL